MTGAGGPNGRRSSPSAKFWLDPVELEYAGGLTASEVRKVVSIVKKNRELLMTAWNDFFEGA